MGRQYPVWHEVPFAVQGGHTLGCMRVYQVGQELVRAHPYRNVKAQTCSAVVCVMGLPVSVHEEWVVGWDIHVDRDDIEVGLNNLPGGTSNTIAMAQVIRIITRCNTASHRFGVLVIELLKCTEEIHTIGFLCANSSCALLVKFKKTNPI